MSLRWKFTSLFAGLGVLISLGIGITMYIDYTRYIKQSYTSTLQNALKLAEQQCPIVSEKDLMEKALSKSQDYWESIKNLTNISDAFGLAFVYFAVKDDGIYKVPLFSGREK